MGFSKPCCLCGETKPLDDFHKASDRRDLHYRRTFGISADDVDALLEAAARYLCEGVTRGVTAER